MLISKKMNAAINEQIGNEFAASLQYVAIASFFATDGLPVLAAHFFKQADEERTHAMRFLKYVLDAGAQVEIPAIAAPKAEFKSAEEAVKLSLDWEKKVTDQVNALAGLAVKESDYTSQNMLAWFTNEQLEEVSSMDNLLRMIRRAGEAGLIHVEAYLARQGAPSEAGADQKVSAT